MQIKLIAAAATLAAAVPATAIAAESGSATAVGGVKTERVTPAQRDRAIRAAKAVVPAGARAVKVERDRHAGDRKVYEVKLRTSRTVYEVDLTRSFRVIDVDRDRIAAGDDHRSDDRGTHDHRGGSGRDDRGTDDHRGGSGRDHAEDD